MRSTVAPSSSASSASVAGMRRSASSTGSSSTTSTSHPQGTRASDVRTYATASKPVGAVDRRLAGHPEAEHPVDPERPQVLTQMVVGGQVPPPRVDDEAVWAQLAPGFVTRERAVRHADPLPPPDGVGEHEHRVPRHRRLPRRAGGEVERRLERLHTSAQPVGQNAVDLRERALDRFLRTGQPEPSRGLDAERDGDRLVVGEHERRKSVARAGCDTHPPHRVGPRRGSRGSAAPRRSAGPSAGRSRAGPRSPGR